MRFPRLITAGAVAWMVAWLWPVGTTILLERTRMPADGRATVRVRTSPTNLFGATIPVGTPDHLQVTPTKLVRTMTAHDGSIVLRAGHRPGTVFLRAGEATDRLELEYDPTDADRDGFPDVAELLTREDRNAFRAWFTAIAEAQATRIDDAWPKVHQDCAGLIRFAYREALREHDEAWHSKHGAKAGFPDVASMRYPHLPIIGDRPFRNIPGPYTGEDPRGFTAAAGAKVLWEYNSRSIGRRFDRALPGDLLFFKTDDGMHSMILLAGDRVVYHTGGADGVRLVSLDMLRSHPDADWHPVPHNPRFLGLYRLDILAHDKRTPLAWGGIR